MRTAERIIDGITVVALGFIFLGSTLGYLPWSIGTTLLALLSLWPVLLVTIGLDIIGRGLNSPWLRIVSSGIALVAVLYGGLVLPATQTQTKFLGFLGAGVGSSHPFSHSAERGSVDNATIVVKGGAGEINVAAGRPDVLAKMTGESPFDNPVFTVNTTGSTASVLASLGSGSIVWPFSGRSLLNLELSPAVVWDVQLETGASSLDANLRDVPTKSLMLKTGASTSDITLGHVPPGTSEAPIRVQSGVATVTLRIPTGTEARIEAQTGLSTVSVPSDFRRLSGSGRTYESAGYQSASQRYVIRVQTGIGTVDIRRY